MASALEEIQRVTDAELVSRVEHLVKVDRAVGVKLLVHLGELDERKLHLAHGYSSMFDYCRNALRMSEAESSLRVKAARVGRRFPLVLERLGSGSVHLSGIKLLAQYFTAENHAELLDRIHGWTKNQIAVLVAEIDPKTDAPARMRRLPSKRGPMQSPLRLGPAATLRPVTPEAHQAPALLAQALEASAHSDVGPHTSPSHSSVPLTAADPSTIREPQVAVSATVAFHSSDAIGGAVRAFTLASPRVCSSTKPLSPGRFKLQVTLGQEAHDKLEQLQELLRHQNPSGDLARIIERALGELLEREMKRRFAQKNGPKRQVTVEPCSETDSNGRACASTVPPKADGQEHVVSELGRSGTAGIASPDDKVASAAKPASSRYIPRKVLREVYMRDGGQCAFVSPQGRRCTARGFLEVDHRVTTFARGAAATADNLRLACRAHNFLSRGGGLRSKFHATKGSRRTGATCHRYELRQRGRPSVNARESNGRSTR